MPMALPPWTSIPLLELVVSLVPQGPMLKFSMVTLLAPLILTQSPLVVLIR